jgi:amino acid adenylation domain-containing protein
METTLSPSMTARQGDPRPVVQRFNQARSIAELVAEQARQRPDALAVVCGEDRLTYRELNARSNQVAALLRSKGAGREKLVGVLMDRTERTVIAILGILKAGAAYLPVDLAYPEDRVAFMLKDSAAVAVITEQQHLPRLGGFDGQIVSLDESLDTLDGQETADVTPGVERSDAAYVIYTSGSTGQPKGVTVTQHNVLRLFSATDHWFGFNEHDVWTVFHSFAFDFSVWELWGALTYGGTAVVVPYLTARSPAAFYELLARDRVTVLNQTPSAFRQLIWAEENAPRRAELALRFVVFGGEALELQSLRPWYERHAADAPLLVNMYGITETTVHVTYRPIWPRDLEGNAGSVIGEPIPDLTIHLLDENGRPVPDGTAGEIFVGGEGVARGYLNRPELSAQRFIADKFGGGRGGRLYRSGDLARRLPNGDLEYLGRIDTQVKIHGFRIELGEIESVLNTHPAVRESVVICDESTGDKRLVAYVVPRGDLPGMNELREFANRRLPAYMLPARVIAIDRMPLTVNGKVDRRALPAPDASRPKLGSEYAAPSTEAEQALAAIWQQVLGVDRVGVKDNFFELGGDSIRSIQVLARAQERGIRFSLPTLFKHPTIAGILANQSDEPDDRIDRALPPFALVSEEDRMRLPADAEDAYPIGHLQHGMIYHSDADKESAIFHDVFSFRLNLPYDRAKLEEAVERLTLRHSIYRTSFQIEGFSQPLQVVHRAVKTPFGEEDLRGETPEQQREKLVSWVEREKYCRFEWSKAPLMRLHVQRHTDETFQFIVSFHHAIMDGWSLAMMLTELFQDYDAIVRGADSGIQPPRVTYRDFIQLESGTVQGAEGRAYWEKKVENPVIHALPRWPHKPERRAHEQTRGPEIYYPASLLGALQGLARECGVPIRTVLLAAHCRVMSLLTGCQDIMTGLVANGRPQCLDGERLIGLFLNTLPFRVNVAEGSWKDLIQQTFRAEQELLPHRRMPLAEIQQIAGGKSLFETTFDFVQFHIYRDLPGYKDHTFLEDHYFEANNFNFFVTFMLDATATELQMHFDYNPNEFSAEQIRAICDCYSEALRAMAASPDSAAASASLLPAAERRKLLSEWNDTGREFDCTPLHELVTKAAAASPASEAVVFGGKRLSYADLENRAARVAAALQERGAGPETLVGICMDRSPDMVAAMLGIAQAGAAYVPLDPAYPRERLAFMVHDSGLKLLLTSEAARAQAAELQAPAVLTVEEAAQCANPFKPVKHAPEQTAYVIYTSGSTGQPKGVQIPQGALLNFLHSMKTEPGLSRQDRLLAVTTLSFDIAGLEIWLPLICGATIVLASAEEAKDPLALAELMSAEKATVLQATPATWNALIHSGWRGQAGLKALCGGEAFPPALASALTERCAEIWNMYGPTETTIWSAVERIHGGEEIVAIGRPIANTEIYVLDPNHAPLPIGSDGEIYIGGDGLARGYLNRASLTAERFVPHPFKPAGRLYRTGDVGRFLPDGRLVCLGRTDNQVKVRGFRIELGEIEAVLEQHPGVRKAVVAARADAHGEKALAAYWLDSGQAKAPAEELRAWAQARLPGHMVPSAWLRLDEFPMTPNGKIDRKRLPDAAASEEDSAASRTVRPPKNRYESDVVEAWRTVLRLPEVCVTDDFFAVGGHSLAAMRVVGSLRTKYHVNVTLASFLKKPTVEALAAHVEKLVREFAAKPGAEKEATPPLAVA